MKQERYYIAGPMTGIPKFNFPAFSVASATLTAAGYSVTSPAELDDDYTRAAALASKDGDPTAYRETTGMTWGDFLARDVRLIADECDAVVVLEGWENSRGARLEVFVARTLNLPVYSYESWLRAPRPDFTEADRLTDTRIAEIMGAEVFAEADALEPAGEVRVTSSTGGQKGKKPQAVGLVPPEALLALSEVYGMGAEKYDDHNYLKGYAWSLSFSAMLRHVLAAEKGEWLDEESGMPHVMHAAWHCFALFMFEKHGLGTDDRISSVVEGVSP